MNPDDYISDVPSIGSGSTPQAPIPSTIFASRQQTPPGRTAITGARTQDELSLLAFFEEKLGI